ncbi:MAG: hypothetical protein ACTSRP_26495 [Candidatus Helarchaeota archaeon]
METKEVIAERRSGWMNKILYKPKFKYKGEKFKISRVNRECI